MFLSVERAVWIFKTRVGTFSIRPDGRGRFDIWFRDEKYGNYHRPEMALDDLVGDHVGSLPDRIDPSKIGLPSDLSEWTFMPPRR